MAQTTGFNPIVCTVGFHHARGPEIEQWFGVEDGTDPAADHDWPFLSFMALADGIHASTEDFSYFTLRRKATADNLPATSLFGISCTRQISASDLKDKPADVTRSTVQKAIVTIADSPRFFGPLREKLSSVTGAWFAQRDFTDVDILKKYQQSLTTSLTESHDEQYLGLSLREIIHEYKHQTLVLFKCCLLQPKMLFFGTKLEDCADPDFDSYAKNVERSTSLKTSDRGSLLAYMGLPLQLFGKGCLFCPYIPLQQLDVLADKGTNSYVVGSTNALLLQNKDRYSDILVNIDESTLNIYSTSLRAALGLSAADRRWIDFLTQTVADTWDESNPSRPNTMGFMGSEEFIRLQFEEYLLALLSSMKYHLYLQKPDHQPLPKVEEDPTSDFGGDWIYAWQQTSSFALFDRLTDPSIFEVVDPRHPTAGNLTIDDVQRRLNQQIQELHLDERFATGKETLNKHLAVGQQKVSTAFSKVWADIEAMREAQRKRAAEQGSQTPDAGEGAEPTATSSQSAGKGIAARAPDLSAAQASVQAAGQKAGAYFSSWGTWAAEKKKDWQKKGEPGEEATPRYKPEVEPPPGKLSRWSSIPAGLRQNSSVKEEKGADGIGRLDA